MRHFSPVLVDVVAVAGFMVLAALGKISPELASGTVLAVLAGRMRPVTARENGGGGSSCKQPKKPDVSPESDNDPTLHSRAEDVPSGILTLLNAPRAAIAALRHY